MLSDDEYTIKPNLTEKFSGIIWKIEIDDVLPLIAVETRDAEARISSNSLFNFATGERLFKEVAVEDSWNWNLDRLHNGMVYLHAYMSKETPLHKGIVALNSEGVISWQAHNKSLLDITDDGLIVYDPKMQPRWLELIDGISGAVIKSSVSTYSSVWRDIQVPEFSYDSALVNIDLGDNLFGEIAWLKFNGKEIASYHLKNNETYAQQLLVTENGNVLLKENLAVGTLKMNPEAFFISRSHLFCIRDDKREIVSYLV